MKKMFAAVGLAIIATLLAPAPAGATAAINPDQQGSLSVYRTVLPAGETSANAAKPAAGAEFTIQRADVDLATNDGWTVALNVAKTGVANSLTFGNPISDTTDSAGVANFANLPIGLYFVTETNPPAGAEAVKSFYVTIPMPDNDSWNYDVSAFPKSASSDDDSNDDSKKDDEKKNDTDNGKKEPKKDQNVKKTDPGITGTETKTMIAIAAGLATGGAWLAILVARLRKRDDER